MKNRSVQLPHLSRYRQAITFIWGGFGLVWITVEGNLAWVIVMGISTTAVSLLHLLKRLEGRSFWVVSWVLGTAVSGALAGVMAVGLTLLFMALKTGLHAHGPEFTPSEINWLIQQLPLWSLIGFLIGSGFGLISAGISK